MTKQKRDNAYYERQLRKHHPGIHADFLAGKYTSLAQALRAAGIKKPRGRLSELKNAWTKASANEQREFLAWIRKHAAVGKRASTSTASTAPVGADCRLESWAAARIQEIMIKRNLRMGDVMQEMGFKRLDASLGRAMHQGSKLNLRVIAELQKWLVANRSI